MFQKRLSEIQLLAKTPRKNHRKLEDNGKMLMRSMGVKVFCNDFQGFSLSFTSFCSPHVRTEYVRYLKELIFLLTLWNSSEKQKESSSLKTGV